MKPGRFTIMSRDEGVASLRIVSEDDPYLGPSWVRGFSDAIATLGAHPSIRAIILEGTNRYFSAGAARTALVGAAGEDVAAYAADAVRAMLDAPVPLVAAAEGHAVGGGLVLALWCDALVLAESSLYGANFMKLAVTPGMGATHVIPEAFGPTLGRELLFGGRLLTGCEIRQACCPVSHAVCPRDHVIGRAIALASEFAEAPRESLVLLKRTLAAERRDALERALKREAAAHARLFADPETSAEIARRYPLPAEP